MKNRVLQSPAASSIFLHATEFSGDSTIILENPIIPTRTPRKPYILLHKRQVSYTLMKFLKFSQIILQTLIIYWTLLEQPTS